MAPSARLAILRHARPLFSFAPRASLLAFVVSLGASFAFPSASRAQPDSAPPNRPLLLGLSAAGVTSREPGFAAARARFDSCLDFVAAHADLVGIGWSPHDWFLAWERFYASPSLERRKLEFALDYGARGLTGLIDLGFWRTVPGDPPSLSLVPAPGGDPALDVLDPELRRQWLRLVELVAGEFRPAYLCLGSNLNLVEANPPSRPAPAPPDPTSDAPPTFAPPNPESAREARRALLLRFSDLAGEATGRVRRTSPRTRVVVGFHYERMRRTGEFDLVSEIDWDVDVIGLSLWPGRWREDPPVGEPPIPSTSIPFTPPLEAGDPPPPPADYVDPLFAAARLPVAFLDVGWTARPDVPAETLGQADFLRRVFDWALEHEVELVRWRELEDLAAPGESDDRRLYGGLLDATGRPKPAWGVWLELVEATRR